MMGYLNKEIKFLFPHRWTGQLVLHEGINKHDTGQWTIAVGPGGHKDYTISFLKMWENENYFIWKISLPKFVTLFS